MKLIFEEGDGLSCMASRRNVLKSLRSTPLIAILGNIFFGPGTALGLIFAYRELSSVRFIASEHHEPGLVRRSRSIVLEQFVITHAGHHCDTSILAPRESRRNRAAIGRRPWCSAS